MGVLDGQPVNQAITNPAFINKNINDVMPNQLGFSRPLSGPTIADIQRAVNNLYTATGVSETQNGTDYNAASGTILNGDSHLVALTKLANKFDSATGHHHTGFAGDGPLLNVVRSLNISGGTPTTGDLTLVAGSNLMILQSITGYTFSAVGSSTTVAASGNPDLTGAIILVAGSGVALSQTGQQIFISASGGGGTGTGNKNYLTTYLGNPGNGDFELGSTVGFSLFNTTLTTLGSGANIPSGTISSGASSIDTFDAVNSGVSPAPLAGVYSLRAAASTSLSSGQGFISDAFTIDNEDKSKILQFKFSYQQVTSGADFSGTQTNTLAVYIYDVTNAVWLQPVGVYSLIQSFGIGIASGSFQSSANSTQYRIAVVCVNAFGSPITMLFDDMLVGPVSGVSVMGRVVAFNATGTPTAAAINGSAHLIFPANTVTIDTYQGYNATTGEYKIPISGIYEVGGAVRVDGTSVGDVVLSFFKTGVKQFDRSGQATSETRVFGAGLMNCVAGDVIYLVPDTDFGSPSIGGSYENGFYVALQSTTGASNDAGNGVVAFRAQSAVSGGTAGNGGPLTTAVFPALGTNGFDTHSGYDTSTGIYTVPVSGTYRITGSLGINSAYLANYDVIVQVVKNGSPYCETLTFITTTYTGTISGLVNCTMSCIAGDQINIAAGANGTGTYDNDVASNFFEVELLAAPTTTISSNESVVASYYVQSTSAILQATLTTIPLTNKLVDTHGTVSSDQFTCPISGIYEMNVMGGVDNPNGGPCDFYMIARKNGVQIGIGADDYLANTAANSPFTQSGNWKFEAVAGDVLDAQLFYANSANRLTTCQVSFERIGP